TESGTQQSTITISDDDSAPTVSLSISSSSIAEAEGTSTATVSLSNATSSAVTVNFGFSGLATSNTDYSVDNSITVSGGSTSSTSTLTAIQDTIYEGSETIVVDISSVSGGGATESGTQQSTITISDDDSAPTVSLSISPSSINEAESSTITTSLSNATTSAVTVNLDYSGTATSGTDYTQVSSITVSSGSTSGTSTLTSLADTAYETDETIIIDISSVSGGGATESGTQQSTLTLKDVPNVTLSSNSSSFSEDGGSGAVTATLAYTSSSDATLYFSFSGLATSNTDYSISATSVTISANSLASTIYVTGLGDVLYEGSESINVGISSLTNASTSSVQSVSFTIADADTAPSVSLSTTSYSIAEASGSSTVTAELSIATTSDVIVNLGLSGLATSNTDYTIGNTFITVSSGSTSSNTAITAIQDTDSEGDETIIIDISSVSRGGASENGTQQITITISDDDSSTSSTSSSNNTSDTSTSVVTVVTTTADTTTAPTTTVSSGSGITVAGATDKPVVASDGNVVTVTSSGTTVTNTDGSVTTTIEQQDVATQLTSTIESTIDPNKGTIFTSVTKANDFSFQTANAAATIQSSVAAPDTASSQVNESGTVITTASIGSNVSVRSEIQINGNSTSAVSVTQTDGTVLSTSLTFPPGSQTTLVPSTFGTGTAANALLNKAIPQDFSITTVNDVQTEMNTDGSLAISVSTFTNSKASTAGEGSPTKKTKLSLPAGSTGSMSLSGAIRTAAPQVTTPSGNVVNVQTATNSGGQTETILQVTPPGNIAPKVILLPKTGSDAQVEIVYNADGSGSIVINTSFTQLDVNRLARSKRPVAQTEEVTNETRFYMGRTPDTGEAVHLYPASADTQFRIEQNFDSEITTIQLVAGEADLKINHGELQPLLDTGLVEVVNTPIHQSIQEGSNLTGLPNDNTLTPWDLETKFDDNVLAVWRWNVSEQAWHAFSSIYPEQLYLNLEVSRILEFINPGDGIWVFANAPTELILSDEDSVDLTEQFSQLSAGWSLLSNGKVMTVQEVLTINPNIQSLWLYRDNQWFAYSPVNTIHTLMEQNEKVNTVPLEEVINKVEAFWVEIPTNSDSSSRLKKPPSFK
ncbi:MAG: hypothetical protein HQM14_13030, partial [SAR324 cluster bacterium]|nr:hypothetical protein [SAR324 cluster bacterium]